VDKVSYAQGILRVDCINHTGIKAHQYPQTQVNATEYSTYNIPAENDGKWIPATFGAPYRPLGRLVDHGMDNRAKWTFNEAVTGHAAIGAQNGQGWCQAAKDYLVVLAGERDTTGVTAGYIETKDSSKELFSTDIIKHPLTAEWKAGKGTDAELSINQDTSDYAELVNPAATSPSGSDNGDLLRLRLPDFPYPHGYHSHSTYFIGKIERFSGLNQGGRTLEHFDYGVEIVDGTQTPDSALRPIITGADTDFNNVDGADSETDIGWIPTPYQEAWSDDNDKGNLIFSTSRLGGRYMNILCWEEEAAGAPDDSQWFKIYYAAIRVQVWVPTNEANYHGDLVGFDDDGSGTYTGSANSLIETPCDLLYFLLVELWGQSMNIAAVTAARTAYGSYILGGQLLDPIPAEKLLDELARNGKSYLFIDANGDWKHVVWEIPGATPDKTFDQNHGDFRTGGGLEVSLDHSVSDELYNQFHILYEWDEGLGKYNKTESVDESSAAADGGAWLTNSQSNWNITRKLTVELPWVVDDDTADSYRIFLIYKHADRKRIVTAHMGFNALEMELADTVRFSHTDLDETANGGSDGHDYNIVSIEEDLMAGTITLVGFQADLPYTALTDPT